MKKQETLEEFIKEILQDEFFTNIAEYKKAERLIEIGAKWQQEQHDCCTPANQIKRYVDCIGCDRKPKQMSKPTALDLYEKEINSLIEKYEAKEISKREFITMKHNLFYNAKEMEKEQLMKSFKHGELPPLFVNYNAEEYYNETYKKEDK